LRLWWHKLVLFEPTRGVAERRLQKTQPRRRLALKRKESAVWSALCNVGGEWCWEWNMEQIVGVWRGEVQGWAVAPVPEFPEQGYAP
jgi:hypothetical protein